jgi:hypothetical protein
MAATGFTPISLYYTTTAAAVPLNTNLVAGELAINTVDEKLYFKNSAGTVKLLASNTATTNVSTFSAGTTGFTPSSATSGAVTLAGTLAVANGGTNATTASITSFNNITGYTASGATGTTSTSLVFSTSPTLTTPTISGYTESVVACGTAGVVGGSFTFVITAGTVLTAILTAGTPCTFTMPASPVAGQSFVLRLTNSATSMTTATFTGVKWPGGTVPTITATASAVDIISFVYIGTAWYGNAAQAFA